LQWVRRWPAQNGAITGDFLKGVTALWTAAHYRIPLPVIAAKNQSFLE
jgi:hypothetical protein